MSDETRRVEITIPFRTIALVTAVFAVAAMVWAVLDAVVIVFIGVFLALVFEEPTRALMRRTSLGRGLASTIVVLGSAAVVALLGLVLLVPLVGGVRDFLQGLPDLVADLRDSDELSWLGDSGLAVNAQEGSDQVAARIPDTISALVGVAGNAFSAVLTIFTVTFLALFLLIDMERLRNAAGSVLMPGTSEQWLDVWERITHTVSRWAIGAVTIATIAGIVQGGTAALLGSSYWIALGLIAGVLDLIPTIGATIAGCILVPTLFAEEGLTAALIMLVVILVYQQIENNVLGPTIYGRAVEISAFFIMLGVTLFGALLGVLGALVAVPVTAALQIIVREVTAARREQVAAARAALEQPTG